MCKKLMFTVSFVLLLVMVGIVSAVELKVDFGNAGTLGDNDPPDAVGTWTQWAETSGSKTIDGITLTLSNGALTNGPKIRDWQAGSNDLLTRDAISEEDPGSGGWYQIEITGLTEGAAYKMRSYHNNCWEAGSFPTTSVSMKLNGGEVATANLSIQQAYTSAGVCEHAFTASAGSDTFKWDFGQTAFFNGFILQTTNPSVQFASAASGGFESVSPAMIEVTLNNAEPGETYSADYAISDGTATAGDDYAAAATGTVVFNPGETSRNISIDILNDGIDEDDETIMLALSNPVGIELALGNVTEHTYTIQDPRPTVGFDQESSDAREDALATSIPVSLSWAATETITVDYAVTGGTATNGVDYTLASGTLTYDVGDAVKTIEVALVDDGIDEGAETVVISLSNFSRGRPGSITEHTLTLVDPSFLDVKVDMVPEVLDNQTEAIPGTHKPGWIAFMPGGWGDLYMHDWRGIADLGGTGLDVCITGICEGRSGMKVNGMCMQNKAGGGSPNGSPVGEPISNSWFTSVDRVSGPEGSNQLGIYNLPVGEYQLTMYHNLWEPCGGGSRECTGCAYSWDPIVQIHVWSLDEAQALIDTLPDWNRGSAWDAHNKMRGFAGPDPGNNVTAIQEAFNVQQSTVTTDEDVATSLVRFETDGSPVIIYCEAGLGESDQYVGNRVAINAFELVSVGGPAVCPCPGDLDANDQVDLQDLDAMVNMLVAAGPPFIETVGPDHCGDMAAPMLQLDLQDLDAMVNLLVAAGPPFIVQCE